MRVKWVSIRDESHSLPVNGDEILACFEWNGEVAVANVIYKGDEKFRDKAIFCDDAVVHITHWASSANRPKDR